MIKKINKLVLMLLFVSACMSVYAATSADKIINAFKNDSKYCWEHVTYKGVPYIIVKALPSRGGESYRGGSYIGPDGKKGWYIKAWKNYCVTCKATGTLVYHRTYPKKDIIYSAGKWRTKSNKGCYEGQVTCIKNDSDYCAVCGQDYAPANRYLIKAPLAWDALIRAASDLNPVGNENEAKYTKNNVKGGYIAGDAAPKTTTTKTTTATNTNTKANTNIPAATTQTTQIVQTSTPKATSTAKPAQTLSVAQVRDMYARLTKYVNNNGKDPKYVCVTNGDLSKTLTAAQVRTMFQNLTDFIKKNSRDPNYVTVP